MERRDGERLSTARFLSIMGVGGCDPLREGAVWWEGRTCGLHRKVKKRQSDAVAQK